MFASFHSNGITPSFNDKLNTLASGILICSTVSISSFGGISCNPGDLYSLPDWYKKNYIRYMLCTFVMIKFGDTSSRPPILKIVIGPT